MTIKRKFITQPRRADFKIPDLITVEMQLKKRNLFSEDQKIGDEAIPIIKKSEPELFKLVFCKIKNYCNIFKDGDF